MKTKDHDRIVEGINKQELAHGKVKHKKQKRQRVSARQLFNSVKKLFL